MHGNGNDFIVINALTENIKFTKNKIAKLACRKKGIGFDQLILVYPPTKIDMDFLIKFSSSMFNKPKDLASERKTLFETSSCLIKSV